MDTNFKKPTDCQGPGRSTRGVQKPGTADQPDQGNEAAQPGRLKISSRNRVISDIMSAVSRLPEVREAKVREIKERIHSGAYAVDSRKVAEAILKNL